jgi:hypothetical protein
VRMLGQTKASSLHGAMRGWRRAMATGEGWGRGGSATAGVRLSSRLASTLL